MRENLTVQEVINMLQHLVANDGRVMRTTPTNIRVIEVGNHPMRAVQLTSDTQEKIEILKEKVAELRSLVEDLS